MNSTFANILQPLLGNETDALLQALQTEPVVSVRMSGKMHTMPSIVQNDHAVAEVPWCEKAYYLSERPQFTLDPLLHAGCYYVQDASSMFVQQVLKQYVPQDAVVLDLCAAPGGKSTLIVEHLNEQGLLIANEVVRQRVFILSENLQKWGKGNIVVTHNSVKDFGERMRNAADCILVDAPCSGEGMMRKDEDARNQWSEKLVRDCAELQRKIITDAWDALREGGIMIYSTCTFNPVEDDENAKWIAEHFEAEMLPVHTEPEWGITETIGYHFFPHKTKGEGFYLCVFRKTAPTMKTWLGTKTPKSADRRTTKVEQVGTCLSWLRTPSYWTLSQADRFINAYPTRHKGLIEYLSRNFLCITLGLGVAEVRGAHLVPQHHLAMARDINQTAFPQIDVALEEALQYLRCEALTPRADTPISSVLITYQGYPLGFVKNVGNRCNNLYPKEWRIRKK